MKKIYLLLLCLLVCVIYACRKESENKRKELPAAGVKNIFSITEAKDYIESTNKVSSDTIKIESSDPDLSNRSGTIDWQNAHSSHEGQFGVVEVPISLSNRKTYQYNFSSGNNEKEINHTGLNAAITRLLIYRDVKNKINYKKIITYIPDKETVAILGNGLKNNWLDKLRNEFSGYVEYLNWDGTIKYVLRINKGIQGTKCFVTPYFGKDKPEIQSTKRTNEICGWVDTPYGSYNGYYDSASGGYIWTNLVYGYNTTFMCFDDSTVPDYNTPQPASYSNTTSGGGSSSSGSTSGSTNTLTAETISHNLPVLDPGVPIDARKFANCFTDGKTDAGYKLTIYVDQPIPGHNDQYRWVNGGIDVGHTFVGFEKDNTDGTSVTQVMGFYPGSVSMSAKGVVKDNSNHSYSQSYTVSVNSTQFSAALNAVILDQQTANYTLSQSLSSNPEYNCTDAAKSWISDAGIYLPPAARGLFVNTPGDFGQAIMTLSGASATPGKAPASHGPCN